MRGGRPDRRTGRAETRSSPRDRTAVQDGGGRWSQLARPVAEGPEPLPEPPPEGRVARCLREAAALEEQRAGDGERVPSRGEPLAHHPGLWLAGDRRLEPGQPPVVEVRAMREAEILAARAHGGRAARLEDLGAERGRGVERDAVPSRLEEEELVAAALEDEEPIAKRRGERLVEPARRHDHRHPGGSAVEVCLQRLTHALAEGEGEEHLVEPYDLRFLRRRELEALDRFGLCDQAVDREAAALRLAREHRTGKDRQVARELGVTGGELDQRP